MVNKENNPEKMKRVRSKHLKTKPVCLAKLYNIRYKISSKITMSYLYMFNFLPEIFLNDTYFVFPETSRHLYFKVPYFMSNHVISWNEDQKITTFKKEKKTVKKEDTLWCYIHTNIMINVLNFKHSNFYIVTLLYAQIPTESTSLAPTYFVYTCM